jgi:adenine-specific DNA-methyltransferase
MKLTKNFDPSADCTLFEGDCLNLLSKIPDSFFNLIVTSPPYNLGKPYETRLKLDEYLEQQKSVIVECIRVLKPTGSIGWQIGNYVFNSEIIPLDIILYPIFASQGLHLRNRIVWHFGHGLHASKRFSGRYEVILWFTKTDDYVFNLDAVRVPQKYPQKKYFKGPKKGEYSGNPLGKNPSDIWEIPNVKANHIEKTSHPCQFPVELIERLVLSLTNEDDWVFDPFMGVGTTAIAALMHNRKVIGAEVVREYIEIAENRIDKAMKGELQIRPMQRPVYDPKSPEQSLPPQKVDITKKRIIQSRLFEKKATYTSSREIEHEKDL